MCDPISLTAGATAMGVMGQLNQGEATKAQYNAQGAMQKMQGDMQGMQLDHSAALAKEDALFQAQMIRKKQKEAIGSADVAAAGSGIVVGEGSAGEADRQIYKDSEQDAFMAIANGNRTANRLNTEADFARAGGANAQTYARVAGDNAESNANMAAFGTVLSGGSKMMNDPGWKTWKTKMMG